MNFFDGGFFDPEINKSKFFKKHLIFEVGKILAVEGKWYLDYTNNSIVYINFLRNNKLLKKAFFAIFVKVFC